MGGSQSKKMAQISTGHNSRLEHESIVEAVAANNKLQRKLLLKQAKKQFANSSYNGVGPVHQNPLMYYTPQQLEESEALAAEENTMFYGSCRSLCGTNSGVVSGDNLLSPFAEYQDGYIYSSPTPQSGLEYSRPQSSSSFLNHPIYLPQASSEQQKLAAQTRNHYNHNQHYHHKHQQQQQRRQQHHQQQQQQQPHYHHQTHEPKTFTSPASSYLQPYEEQNYAMYQSSMQLLQQQQQQQPRRRRKGMKKNNMQVARPHSQQQSSAASGKENSKSSDNLQERQQQELELEKGEVVRKSSEQDKTITSETLEEERAKERKRERQPLDKRLQSVEQRRQATNRQVVELLQQQQQQQAKRNVRQSLSSTESFSGAYNDDEDDDNDDDDVASGAAAAADAAFPTSGSNPGATNASFAVEKTQSVALKQRSSSSTSSSETAKGLAEEAELKQSSNSRKLQKERPAIVDKTSTSTQSNKQSDNNTNRKNIDYNSLEYSPTSSEYSDSGVITYLPSYHQDDSERKQQTNQPIVKSKQDQSTINSRSSNSGIGINSEENLKRTRKMSKHQERGLAFTKEQRERLNLVGLPAAVQDQDLQVKAVMNFVENCCQDELSRYVYLRHLKDFNENLFYASMAQNVEKLMPLVYTPTVGLACQKFSHIYLRPRGLFITPNDSGRISKILAALPAKDIRVIVVTDGERILGLGDLGANGMGISIGKLSLYTALAGIPPKDVLPVCIDVGTNNEFNLKDPFYIGLRQERVRGAKYDQLIEEFMEAVVERWGRSCLIQFEDFANSTAFNLLQRYRERFCTFNDDIQGTASVCLSGLISAAKLIGRRLSECKFLFYGAGEANLGTVNLLLMAMEEEGATSDQAKKSIWLIDSKGLVVNERTDLSSHKRQYARDGPQIKDLEAIIEHVKPAAIIGASAQGGAFNESICRKMAQFNERPIIFALSNPTSKAECTAKEAYTWTQGRCVFASGSPFEPVQYEGKTYITGQGNNAYIFPGVGLAAIGAQLHTVPEELFLVAARALSDQLTEADTSVGLVYPRLNRIQEVTLTIATRVLEHAYKKQLATYRPEPEDKRSFLRAIQFDPRYDAADSINGNSHALNKMSLADSNGGGVNKN